MNATITDFVGRAAVAPQSRIETYIRNAAFDRPTLVLDREAVAGQYHALKAGLGDHPLVGEIRSFGLLAAIEIVSNKQTRARFQPEGSAPVVIRDHAIANGLMMRAVMDTMIMSPPLIWTKETIDMAVERVRIALDLAAKDLL